MQNGSALFGLMVAAVAAAASPASAALITYTFQGTVTQVGAITGGPITSVAVGDPFTLTFTVDDTATDSEPNPAAVFVGAVSDVSWSFGGAETWTSTGWTITSTNYFGNPGAAYFVRSEGLSRLLVPISGPNIDGHVPEQASLTLLNTNAAVGTPPLLPPSDLTPFTANRFFLFVFAGGSFVEATLATVVPEPATLALLAIGFAGLTRAGSRPARPHAPRTDADERSPRPS